MKKVYKTIILGSGIIGSTIAYHLSKQEDGILIIDKHAPASGTSSATQAWVWVHTKKPDFYAELSMYSSELYLNLKKELSYEFEFHRSGGITPIFTEEEWENAEKLVQTQKKVGINVKLLSKKRALKKEPALNPSIIGAMYSPLDAHVNPMRLVYSLIKEAEKNGVQTSFYNEVIFAEKLDAGGYKVETQQGTFFAERLVIAGGPWAPQIGKWFDIDIPIELVKGQIMVTEPIQPIIKHIVRGMRQTNNGELLIGMSSERTGFDRSTTFDVLKQSAQLASHLIPALEDVKIVRHFAGIRAVPKDKLPIFGEVDGHEGLFVAATHSGITLAPIIGLLMTEIISGKEPTISYDPYDIKRFEKSNKVEV
ncbi:FAD-binding oxidoreductase [Bacillus tianshenii]|nr:FAD-binding oxidoreductase [Bacillus tianshenii]